MSTRIRINQVKNVLLRRCLTMRKYVLVNIILYLTCLFCFCRYFLRLLYVRWCRLTRTQQPTWQRQFWRTTLDRYSTALQLVFSITVSPFIDDKKYLISCYPVISSLLSSSVTILQLFDWRKLITKLPQEVLMFSTKLKKRKFYQRVSPINFFV